jgi:hypothetical protein
VFDRFQVFEYPAWFLFTCFYFLPMVDILNFATWSTLNFKTNVKVVLFKWENLIKRIWWLSVTSIAWGNHLGSFYRYPICGPPFFLKLFNSSLLWDVFIINSVEQLQTRGVARYKMKCRHNLGRGIRGPHKAPSRSRAEPWWGVQGGEDHSLNVSGMFLSYILHLW